MTGDKCSGDPPSRTPLLVTARPAAALFLAFFAGFAQAPGNELRGDALQQAILQSWRSGQKRFRIPPGTYWLPPTAEGPHLRFEHVSDFEIDATNVELVFTDRTRGGIEFNACRNVSLHGATIRYETPPFTQGVVEAIAPDGRWYDIRIDHGYPADFDDTRYFPAAPVGYLFNPETRQWKPGTFDLYGERIERLDAGRFRVHWTRPLGSDVHPAAVGDLIAFRGSGPHNITVTDSERIHLSDITIFNSPNFAILESGGEGDNHYTVEVRRGSPPPGAHTAPLLSSTADAFHSVNARKGPVLEGCHFESMADDGIAIHGTFAYVLQAKGGRLVISKGAFRPGDPIRLFDARDRPAGDAVVGSVRPLSAFSFQGKSQRDTLEDNTIGPYFEITIRPPLPAGFDFVAADPAAEGSGYILRGNTIRNHRARGMLLKADNGLIENNTVEGSTMGGIVITPEFWWNEASFSRHVLIRNNTIRRVAYAPAQLGGVIIAAVDPSPVAGCGHGDIRVEGNRLEDISGVNLLITSICRVVVRGNQFVNPQHALADAAGKSWGESPGALIVAAEAREVTFQNNLVRSLGAFNKVLLQIFPSARVAGEKRGLRVVR